jgi:hypothetical protein
MSDYDLRFDINQIRQNLRNASKEQNPNVLAELVRVELKKLDDKRQNEIMALLEAYSKRK